MEMAWIKFGFGSALGRRFRVGSTTLFTLRARGLLFCLHVMGWDGWFCHCGVGRWFGSSGWVGGWTDGFVWLHVACGDIGCGRLVCSSRAALVERWRLWVFFMVDELGF